jgi:hypothetical protein
MSYDEPKVHCGHVSSSGRRCSAWAIRGSDPPRCAAHSERKGGAGAPSKDQDRGAHSFYRPALHPEELADLIACAEDLSLDDEIATTRITLRRILALLSADGNPQGHPQEGHPQGGAPTGSGAAMTQDGHPQGGAPTGSGAAMTQDGHPQGDAPTGSGAAMTQDGHPHGGAPTGCGPAMTLEEYARLAALSLAGARTVARLLRDKRALAGEAADGISGAIAQAIDELATEWGVDLSGGSANEW